MKNNHCCIYDRGLLPYTIINLKHVKQTKRAHLCNTDIVCLQLGNALRCPATKFISHTLSHICFLVLLTAATFRVDQPTIYPITSSDDFDHSKYEHLSYAEKAENVLRTHFRPANVLMCKVQLCLMFWVIGK